MWPVRVISGWKVDCEQAFWKTDSVKEVHINICRVVSEMTLRKDIEYWAGVCGKNDPGIEYSARLVQLDLRQHTAFQEWKTERYQTVVSLETPRNAVIPPLSRPLKPS